MKLKRFSILILFFVLFFGTNACSYEAILTIEEHAIEMIDWEGETLVFEPIAGTREGILAVHEDERVKPAIIFTAPVTIAKDTIHVEEHFNENLVRIDVLRGNNLELSIDAGVISPIDNYRGVWVIDGHWYLEIAHVEENANDPNASYNIWGEIFKDGISLNEVYGFDETFNFQILAGKPFFFYKSEDLFGFSYDGKIKSLNYTDIPHYLCCSASAFNPKASENMVAFFASNANGEYYVEIGKFN